MTPIPTLCRRLAGLGVLLAVLAPLPAAAAASCPALLQQTQPRLQDERPIDLCSYAGKVLLVVNTASYCGYTPQYKSLEALYEKYRDKGLVVLGFPSNDFGEQEPGSNRQIAEFCENTFNVRFPMFAKSSVAADAQGPVNPLYVALRQRTGQAPAWNFHKYLVSRDGQVVSSYGSRVEPRDAAFVAELDRMLAAH